MLVTVLLVSFSTTSRTSAAAGVTFEGHTYNVLKFFGQSAMTETSNFATTPFGTYHATGIIVDQSSRRGDSPDKVYVVDHGNNRILGYNGVGRCATTSSFPSCPPGRPCTSKPACIVDGTKAPDLVFGQSDFRSGSCNRDNNVGIMKPTARDELCLAAYPNYTNNTAEDWQSLGIALDRQGNLYVPDVYNNRILKYNRPFDPSVPGGGDTIADAVWGQPDFHADGPNQAPWFTLPAPTPSAGSLDQPRAVDVDPWGNVWVADTGNGRVLRFPPTSGSSADVILSNFADPIAVRFNPQTRELYVLDVTSHDAVTTLYALRPTSVNADGSVNFGPSQVTRRVIAIQQPLVPNPTPGATPSMVPFVNWPRGVQQGAYDLQATAMVNNPYDQTTDPAFQQYKDGVLWINEGGVNIHSGAYRTILIDDDGTILAVIGAPDVHHSGGESVYAGCPLSISSDFQLGIPTGTIGFDSDNNIYIPDERFHRIARYSLPYTVDTSHEASDGSPCLPRSNGGLFPGVSPNVAPSDLAGVLSTVVQPYRERIVSQVSESPGQGMAIYNSASANQLLVLGADGVINVWNDYMNKPNSSPPDYFVSTGDGYNIFGQGHLDDKGHLWVWNNQGTLNVFQLPIQSSDATPIARNIALYWADDNTPLPPGGNSLAFDAAHGKLYISDPGHNRVLRATNVDQALQTGKLLVDMVIGQMTKTGDLPNHGAGMPVPDGLWVPTEIKFDRYGNLYVVENAYECHGNDRITVFMNGDLNDPRNGMFPDLSAKKSFVNPLSGYAFTNPSCASAYSAYNRPASPISVAFDSHNHMVVGNDGYYGQIQGRQVRQLWFYTNPLQMTRYGTYVDLQTPDDAIAVPMGSTGELTFDANDNLFIQDHTWDRVWGINLNADPSWFTTPWLTSASTPTPRWVTHVYFPLIRSSG